LQAVFSGISHRKLLDPGKNAGVNNDMNCVTPKLIKLRISRGNILINKVERSER
jgi:hypothetical protein